jgi:hypothetical protein
MEISQAQGAWRMVDEQRIPASLALSGVEQASRLPVLASRQNILLLKGILAGRQNGPAGRRFHQ